MILKPFGKVVILTNYCSSKRGFLFAFVLFCVGLVFYVAGGRWKESFFPENSVFVAQPEKRSNVYLLFRSSIHPAFKNTADQNDKS